MFVLLIETSIFCFVIEYEVGCELVKGYIAFIVYDITTTVCRL